MIVRMAVSTPGGMHQVLETEEMDHAPLPSESVRILDRTFRVLSRAWDVPEKGPIVLAILLQEMG